MATNETNNARQADIQSELVRLARENPERFRGLLTRLEESERRLTTQRNQIEGEMARIARQTPPENLNRQFDTTLANIDRIQQLYNQQSQDSNDVQTKLAQAQAANANELERINTQSMNAVQASFHSGLMGRISKRGLDYLNSVVAQNQGPAIMANIVAGMMNNAFGVGEERRALLDAQHRLDVERQNTQFAQAQARIMAEAANKQTAITNQLQLNQLEIQNASQIYNRNYNEWMKQRQAEMESLRMTYTNTSNELNRYGTAMQEWMNVSGIIGGMSSLGGGNNVSTAGLDPDVVRIAREYGEDPFLATAILHNEEPSGNLEAVGDNGQSHGWIQMQQGALKDIGATEVAKTKDGQLHQMFQYMGVLRNQLNALGVEPTPRTLAMAYNGGAQGATNAVRAEGRGESPTTSAIKYADTAIVNMRRLENRGRQLFADEQVAKRQQVSGTQTTGTTISPTGSNATDVRGAIPTPSYPVENQNMQTGTALASSHSIEDQRMMEDEQAAASVFAANTDRYQTTPESAPSPAPVQAPPAASPEENRAAESRRVIQAAEMERQAQRQQERAAEMMRLAEERAAAMKRQAEEQNKVVVPIPQDDNANNTEPWRPTLPLENETPDQFIQRNYDSFRTSRGIPLDQVPPITDFNEFEELMRTLER